MKSLNKILLSLILPVTFVLFVPAIVFASAAGEAIREGASNAGGATGGDAQTSINSTIESVINIMSVVGGILATAFIVIGGVKYVTSNGDSSKAASARTTILYSVIGLVIILLAQIIVQFVITTSTNPTASSGGSTPCVQLPNGGCATGTGP